MSTVVYDPHTWWAQYKIDVPEGSSGPWTVERFTVSAQDAELERLRSMFNGGRGCPEGTYTRLCRNSAVVMSDTRDEIADHLGVIHRCKDTRVKRVLINGLGLGVVLGAVLRNDHIEHVDVVEVDADVIALVGSHYADARLTIHHGDAYTIRWPKGLRWDVAWHDVWDDLCEDNLPLMAKLHRRYGRRVSWQTSWGRCECLAQRERGW